MVSLIVRAIPKDWRGVGGEALASTKPVFVASVNHTFLIEVCKRLKLAEKDPFQS
jgi:hypothetical protein